MANVHPIGIHPRRTNAGRKARTSEKRQSTNVRIVQSQRDQLEKITEQLGDEQQGSVPLSDYCAYVIAAAHGWPIPDYLQDVERRLKDGPVHLQEVLPLALDA